MSNKSFGLSSAVQFRARKEGVKGCISTKSKTKRWARRGMTKVARAESNAEIRSLVAELESDMAEHRSTPGHRPLPFSIRRLLERAVGRTEIRVKGKSGVRFVEGKAFTSPSDFHLKKMGFSKIDYSSYDYWDGTPDFAGYAEHAWATRFAA